MDADEGMGLLAVGRLAADDIHRPARRLVGVDAVGAIGPGRRMDRRQPVEEPLHDRTQGLVGAAAVGELGVAADRRNDLGMQDGPGRRGGLEAPVAVPGAAEHAVGLVGLAAHLEDVRPVRQRLHIGIEAKAAELQGEGLQLVMVQRLVREPDHPMRRPRRLDRRQLIGRQRRADIQTSDLGAEAGSVRCDGDHEAPPPTLVGASIDLRARFCNPAPPSWPDLFGPPRNTALARRSGDRLSCPLGLDSLSPCCRTGTGQAVPRDS